MDNAKVATNVSVDNSLGSTSKIPVQNKVIYSQLHDKVGIDSILNTTQSIANTLTDHNCKLPTLKQEI